MVDGVACVVFALNSFKSHPVMALPKCDATLEIWIANPVALARLVKWARERETFGSVGTGLTYNISREENALVSVSIQLTA
jgi:hypothetical protein